MGINRVVDQYGILRMTLKDRLSGRVIQWTNLAPIPYLSASEEDELFQRMLTFTEISCPKTKYPVIGIVRQAVDKKRGADAAKKNYRERLVKSIFGKVPKDLPLQRRYSGYSSFEGCYSHQYCS